MYIHCLCKSAKINHIDDKSNVLISSRQVGCVAREPQSQVIVLAKVFNLSHDIIIIDFETPQARL